jgi:hypothetical protein
MWSTSISLQDEMDDKKKRIFLADNLGGLLRILQRVPRLSKVW